LNFIYILYNIKKYEKNTNKPYNKCKTNPKEVPKIDIKDGLDKSTIPKKHQKIKLNIWSKGITYAVSVRGIKKGLEIHLNNKNLIPLNSATNIGRVLSSFIKITT
jgi:hypothetical protein